MPEDNEKLFHAEFNELSPYDVYCYNLCLDHKSVGLDGQFTSEQLIKIAGLLDRLSK